MSKVKLVLLFAFLPFLIFSQKPHLLRKINTEIEILKFQNKILGCFKADSSIFNQLHSEGYRVIFELKKSKIVSFSISESDSGLYRGTLIKNFNSYLIGYKFKIKTPQIIAVPILIFNSYSKTPFDNSKHLFMINNYNQADISLVKEEWVLQRIDYLGGLSYRVSERTGSETGNTW